MAAAKVVPRRQSDFKYQVACRLARVSGSEERNISPDEQGELSAAEKVADSGPIGAPGNSTEGPDWHWDPELDVLECSEQMRTVHGLPPHKALRLDHWLEKIHALDRQALRAALIGATEHAVAFELDYRRTVAGRDLWTHVNGAPFRAAGRDGLDAAGSADDVHEARMAVETASALEAVLAASRDAIVRCSATGLIRGWNDAARLLTGLEAGQALGLDLRALFAPELASQANEWMQAAGVSGRNHGQPLEPHKKTVVTGQLETVWVTARGERLDVALTVVPTRVDGDPTGLTVIARDLGERKRYQEALARRALYDGLTELPNRAMFVAQTEEALDTRAPDRLRDELVAVLVVDLDDFRFVNDTAGHAAGDALLVEIAARLCACVRPPETVARLGGDEFAVVLPSTTTSEAIALADRILAAIAVPVLIDARMLHPKASIGIVTNNGQWTSADELIRDADLAMDVVKARGKGEYQLFEPEMHNALLVKLRTQVELERALESEELTLHYQPILDTRTGEIECIEALVRWTNPERGLLEPDQFISLAEATGMIVPLGAWVIREACAELARLRNGTAARFRVAVNLAAAQVDQPRIAETVHDALEAAGLEPSDLVLELTESAVMENSEHALVVLEQLHASGIQISIDDFGTGYSSLARLRRLPVSQLKIDRSFIEEIDTHGNRAPVLAAIVAMARAVGLEVVAEGVETVDQFRALSRIGCDYLQGFLFSRPLPASELRELLTFAAPFEASFRDEPLPTINHLDAELMDVIGLAASGQPTLEGLMRPLLSELERLTGMESTYLTRIDWPTNTQHIVFSRNAGDLEITEGSSVDWEDTICRRALSGGPAMTDNVPRDFPDSESACAIGLQSYVSVPITGPDGAIWGTLCAASTRPHQVGEQVRHTMELFTPLISEQLLDSDPYDERIARVVIADDSAVARKLLQGILSVDRRLVLVGEAVNGAEALDVVAREAPDIVTLDLDMPVMDGREALMRLRARDPQLAVIVFTGHEVTGVVAELKATGATEVLPKQATPNQILAAVHRVVFSSPSPSASQPTSQ